MRTIEQAIDDWFRNSPSWPFDIDVEKEVDDFMRDGCEWSREEVRAAIVNFKCEAIVNLKSSPEGAGSQSEQD